MSINLTAGIVIGLIYFFGILFHLEEYVRRSGERKPSDYFFAVIWPLLLIFYWVIYRPAMALLIYRGKATKLNIESYWDVS